jgi:hypothetical protein
MTGRLQAVVGVATGAAAGCAYTSGAEVHQDLVRWLRLWSSQRYFPLEVRSDIANTVTRSALRTNRNWRSYDRGILVVDDKQPDGC